VIPVSGGRFTVAKYNLALVTVQDVRRVTGGSQPADDYIFLYGNGNVNHLFGTGFFVHKGIVSGFEEGTIQ
jgi:hypothetical protein